MAPNGRYRSPLALSRTESGATRDAPCRTPAHGNSKDAVFYGCDGLEAVFGEGFADGGEGTRQRPDNPPHGVAQRRKSLRRVAGADTTGVFVQSRVAAAVKAILDPGAHG